MIADNIVHFARVLRGAGMAIGPDRVLAALAAVELVGLQRRDDVHAALSAVMLERHEQQPLFDAAFDTFWRDPKLLEQMMYLLLPKISGRGDKQRPPRANRLAEALSAPKAPEPPNPANQTAKEEVQFDTHFTFSDRERLQKADFETMTTAEYELAQRLAEQMPLPVEPVRRRRHAPAASARDGGRLDLRATLQRMARQPAHAGAALHPAARGDARAGGAAGYLRLDGPLLAADAALRAWPDAPCFARAHADLRHAADQPDALPERA